MVILFHFFKNHHNIFHRSCTIPENTELGFLFIHILATTCYFYFLIVAILMGMMYISLWFWFAFPYWFEAVEDLFSCLLATCVSSLKKRQFKFFVHFLIRLYFLSLCCRHSLYIHDINPCYGLNCVHPSNSYVEALNPQCDCIWK